MGTEVHAGVFLLKLGFITETPLFRYTLNSFIRLFLCIYLTVIHFYPQSNICFLSLYGIKVYEGRKDWTTKYHKYKPMQLVTTNISLFEKGLRNKEFLSWLILWTDKVSSWNWVILLGSKNPSFIIWPSSLVLGTERWSLVQRILFYCLAFLLSSWNWVMILGSKDPILLFGLHP